MFVCLSCPYIGLTDRLWCIQSLKCYVPRALAHPVELVCLDQVRATLSRSFPIRHHHGHSTLNTHPACTLIIPFVIIFSRWCCSKSDSVSPRGYLALRRCSRPCPIDGLRHGTGAWAFRIIACLTRLTTAQALTTPGDCRQQGGPRVGVGAAYARQGLPTSAYCAAPRVLSGN